LTGKKITTLKYLNGKFYAGSDEGIYQSEDSVWTPFYLPEEKEIAANHVTAILPYFGDLWVGTFDRGFEILNSDGSVKSKPPEGPAWAINGFLADGDSIWIAHNAGVSVYRGEILTRHITKSDGLIGSRVSAVCAIPGGRAYATESGLTLDNGAGLSSIYAFHGLANNHIYACVSIGDVIYIGTLGGLNAIQNRKVVKTWRPGETPLKTGWITALAVSGKDLFVGTYGGGVQKLGASEQWTGYSDSIGSFEVNPGAMLVSGNLLLVGSLDKGLFIMDLSTEKWRNIADGLASQNVTAIARDANNYYIGTDMGITVIPVADIEGKK
jgi:ligand-binding sensor domain-containing protein